MAIFKCKMCGGTIEFEKGESIGTCAYCGTKQTLPNTNDDIIANLYNRANNLRLKSEFDRAQKVYEDIVNKDDAQAEAHWGIVLCKYGIEYVDDPATGKKIPTCHRTSYEAIRTDADYQAAIDYADTASQSVYEEEAREIDKIQRGILAIAKEEKPFDVFICYKETDESGSRTVDSTIANDIYYQLTQEGFKVFYAAITLEDKLGQEYEPYIFAALNSAKVMLAIGTKPEYFNAVWVKNEWSRYLKLMKADRSRLLIPCYRDMDAYDLPEEFAHLQAQDMSKIGFINDVVRGIKKVLVKDEPQKNAAVPQSAQQTATNETGNITALLDRGFMALEDGEWEHADGFFEQALNFDAKNAQAYLGKLMAQLKVSKEADLANCEQPFDNNGNYQKAVRFADASLKSRIESYIKQITDRINAKETELNKTVDAVAKAVKEKNAGRNIVPLKEQLAEEKEKLAELQALAQSFDSILAEIEKEKSEVRNIEVEINGLKTKRESLSLFAVKEKKQIDTEIEELDAKKLAAENALNSKTAKLLGFSTKQEVEAAVQQVSGRIPELEAQVQESANSGNIELTYLQAIKLYYYDEIIRTRVNTKYPELADTLKTVKLGSYHQSSENSKEPIEWEILDTTGDKFLLISRYALDCKKYNENNADVTWETCTLRRWLNTTFLNVAFSPAEQAKIQTTLVTADKNPKFNTSPGNDTDDKVFLLSISEAKKYFASDTARECRGTVYCYAQGADKAGNGNCWWWLRSPGIYFEYAAYVGSAGNVYAGGKLIDYDTLAVRPAMWVKF